MPHRPHIKKLIGLVISQYLGEIRDRKLPKALFPKAIEAMRLSALRPFAGARLIFWPRLPSPKGAFDDE
jgi:hypothetical protein